MFSGKVADYDNWRVLVSDWMKLEGREKKYPGLEMRRAMQGSRGSGGAGTRKTHGKRGSRNVITVVREVF